MTLTIDLSPQTEAWIFNAAQHRGVPPAEFVRRMLDERAVSDAPAPVIDAKNAEAIAWLKQRLADEATDDPEEIRKSEEDFAELKRNLNANRAATGERLTFP